MALIATISIASFGLINYLLEYEDSAMLKS